MKDKTIILLWAMTLAVIFGGYVVSLGHDGVVINSVYLIIGSGAGVGAVFGYAKKRYYTQCPSGYMLVPTNEGGFR